MKMLLIDHDHLVDKIRAKYGPVYSTITIPKGTYPNQTKDNKVAAVWNIMATPAPSAARPGTRVL